MMQELPKTERTILLKAAQLVRELDWCQFRLQDRDGRVCALGAIFVAGGIVIDNCRCGEVDAITRRAWDKVAARVVEAGYANVPDWNDYSGRTIKDVVELLEDVAMST